MADIRINALATTAASTASDDFVAVDGSANGTRKLNAFSPTFGGNLTVSGTGTSSVAGVFKAGTDIVTGDTSAFQVHNNVDDKPMVGFYRGGTLRSVLRLNTDNDFRLLSSDLSTPANLTIGNLTVSGTGTSTIGTTNTVSFTDSSLKFTGSAASPGALSFFSNSNILFVQSGSAGLYFNNAAGSATNAVLTNAGNLLIGTTIDGGQKLQVSGTGTFSNTTASTPTIALNTTQTSTGLSFLSAITGAPSSERNWSILTNAGAYGDFVIRVSNAQGGNPITAGTTALTLDSSQRCILAGALRLNNAYVAGAPTATGYVTLQDSAGNTYKVLVGT